jgi:uncharacterized membrane protein YgaE (UPF0421/DUF939 family)
MQGSASGALATVLGTSLGWLDARSLVEAIILAAVGGVVGFIVNLICKWIWIKTKQRFPKIFKTLNNDK